MKRTWTIRVGYIFWPIIFALCVWFVRWVIFVPGDETRAITCPRRESLIQVYDAAEAVRPLKAYERRRLEDLRRYVERWCQ